MKKKKVLAVLVALLILAGTGVYTYARYVYTKSGSGSKNVATWAVVLKQGGSPVTDDFELALTLSTNNNVVNGKIAPGRSATATLVLDLTGTEVATDIEVDLSGVTGLPDGMSITGVTANGVAMTSSAGVYKKIIQLNDAKTAISTNTVTLVITAAWLNNESNNANDTTFGSSAGTLTIPVTVTAKQHLVGTPTAEACFNYTTNNNEVTITDYYDYEGNNNENPACPRRVVIPDTLGGNPVVAIGTEAFAYNSLTGVIMPNTITTLGDRAFRSSGTFEEVKLSSNLQSIGQGVFIWDTVPDLVLPNTVTTIANMAFQGVTTPRLVIPSSVTSMCTSCFTQSQITELVIDVPTIADAASTAGSLIIGLGGIQTLRFGDHVQTIGNYTFSSASALGSVIIGNNVTSIGDNAFLQSHMTNLTLGTSVETIGANAFAQNSLTELVIPSSVTSIGMMSFAQNLLSSVTLGAGLTTIGNSAFMSNSLTSITIPSNVTSIGAGTFMTNQLTSVCIKGKSSLSDFAEIMGPPPFMNAWASGYSDENITWNCMD